jgi:S-adenosyl methyltransferase
MAMACLPPSRGTHRPGQPAFLARAIRYLTGEAGLRQFLDIGTGMPACSNIHEVAQSVAPQARVVYVDHDPIVLCHARAPLISAPEGRTDFIEADLRQPLAILSEAARTLDFGRPVAIILTAILHLIQDDEEPYQLVRQLVGALAPGSYVVISHAAADIGNGDMASMTSRLNELMAQQTTPRNRAQVSQFFEGLDLVEPGLVRGDRVAPGHGHRREGPGPDVGRGGPQASPRASPQAIVTRARLRQNRSRSPDGSTSVSRSSEAETSRWNALATSRPSGVSATETARRSPGTAVRATRPRRSARSASPVSAAFSMPSSPASSDMRRGPAASMHSSRAWAAGSP